MSIKDKITLELKYAMMDSIEKAEKSGNEHGFLMCADKDRKLYPSGVKCEGDSCSIYIHIHPEFCPKKKIQGFFHVHPDKLKEEKRLGRKIKKGDIKDIFKVDREGNAVILQTPSHTDVLTALLEKCDKSTEGTVCITSDLEPDKVGCWTPRTGAANFATCYYAKRDNVLTKSGNIAPKMWIKPLFKKELINLRDIH